MRSNCPSVMAIPLRRGLQHNKRTPAWLSTSPSLAESVAAWYHTRCALLLKLERRSWFGLGCSWNAWSLRMNLPRPLPYQLGRFSKFCPVMLWVAYFRSEKWIPLKLDVYAPSSGRLSRVPNTHTHTQFLERNKCRGFSHLLRYTEVVLAFLQSNACILKNINSPHLAGGAVQDKLNGTNDAPQHVLHVHLQVWRISGKVWWAGSSPTWNWTWCHRHVESWNRHLEAERSQGGNT